MCVRVWACEGHGVHVEVRGQQEGVNSLLLCEFQGLNSGCQAGRQVP